MKTIVQKKDQNGVYQTVYEIDCDNSDIIIPALTEQELSNKGTKITCDNCGCDSFRVYITVIIDDAELFCSNCGHNQL